MITNFCSTLAGHHLKCCKKGVDKYDESSKRGPGAGVPNMWVHQLGEKEAEEVPRSGFPYLWRGY